MPSRPRGGSGDETRSARSRLSEYGLGVETPSQVLPTPAGPRPAGGSNAGRAAPAVSRANWPLRHGGEPAALGMATGLGTNAYRDRPGLVPRHSRLALRGRAAGVRLRVGCGPSAAVRLGVAPAADSKAGSPSIALATAAVTPEKR